MSDYREVARTARSYVVSQGMTPKAAWDEAAARAFKNNSSKAKNGYPRSTFIALCEAGLVKGIPAGSYLDRAGDVREYAVRLVELLVADPNYEDETEDLFSEATKGRVPENGQLDVLFGLWNHGLIERPPKPGA